jgi:hypothetical protein
VSSGAASADAMLIVAPEGRDASVLLELLAGVGISAQIDQSGDALLRAIETGGYAGAIITDEAITRVGLTELRAAVDRQPTWSDFPFIILVRRNQPFVAACVRGSLPAISMSLKAHAQS